MNCIAVIPARGGSKGIPRKNLAVVGGLPLVAWSIMHAKQAACVRNVFVTSDDDSIGELARSTGASFVRRPASLSGDTATTEDAVINVLEQTHDSAQPERWPEWVLTLQPTSPLRPAGAIDAAWARIQADSDGVDSLFSARVVDGYCWNSDAAELKRLNGPRQMRQDRTDEVLEENGSFYFTRTSMLRETRDRLCGRVAAYVMEPLDSFQVDEPSDLALMESLMQVRLPQIAMQHIWRQSQERKASWLGI